MPHRKMLEGRKFRSCDQRMGAREAPNVRDPRTTAVGDFGGNTFKCEECPAWQSLGESNPSFQVENLTS